MIQRHEPERRVDDPVHHRNVEAIFGRDRIPVVQVRSTERIDSQPQPAHRLQIEHVAQVAHVGSDEVVLFQRARPQRAADRVRIPQQLVRARLDPPRRRSVGRSAARRVVLDASILRGIVRGRDHDPVREPARESAVVGEDRVRNHRGRRGAARPEHVHVVGGQHLQRRVLRRIRERVRVLAKIERAARPLRLAVLADRLGHGEDVRLVEGPLQS